MSTACWLPSSKKKSKMRKVFLGIDTSNYKTSAALFYPDTLQWQSEGSLLPVKNGELGLRQSDALFMHVKSLPDIIERLELDGCEIVGVGYSDRPRAIEDSYMPCFLAGACTAKGIASVNGVCCNSYSHQQGHIVSAAFSADKLDLIDSPFYAWHLSGGTTELLYVEPSDGLFSTRICGGTTDISAGQLIDRAGVALGMDFPAGPYVEKSALTSVGKLYHRVKVNDGYFSLSGIENKITAMISNGETAADVCAFTLNTVAYSVKTATEQLLQKRRLPVLVSGGVSVCSFIKNAFCDMDEVYFAQYGLGGDNALGAAILCARTEGQL